MSEDFPPVKGGGSLILAWQIRNKRVLVVGGGEVSPLHLLSLIQQWRLTNVCKVAAGRILNVLDADAKVTLISPRDGLNPEVAYRVEKGQVDYRDRKFEPSDLDNVDMVLTAIDDPEASTSIWKLCKEKKIAANIADVPPECDFYFGSVHRDGLLQIMVSTNGNGPKLASIVRKQIAQNLPKNIGAAVQKVGTLRKKLRKVAPDIEEGPKRMGWMKRVCEQWSLEDLVEMDEQDMETLLGFYKPNAVPTFEEIRCGDLAEGCAFDGSFGWWI
ncbi:MAG: Bifunctional dehydrogenase and ferrochelatase [Alectoria fallacina]|uniref:precorrin-2 dehydrogenase n=1 Tax=Alectoria fallacina TaxID=1903189 RepID=A0A8H3FGL6_9LECA|nr:MAG: Bifunctional dehydrogenase and ferrochelatase [Alectoria fallacina]